MKSSKYLRTNSKYLKAVIDSVAVFLGFMVALSIRFEFSIPRENFNKLLLATPVLVCWFLAVNLLMEIYAGRYKYASFDEVLSLLSAATLATGGLALAVLLIPGARSYVPISVAVMGGVLSLFAMAFARLEYRLLGEIRLQRKARGRKRVLLVGAGEAGEMIARDMMRHPEYDYFPAAFVDDDPAKKNLVLRGVPVLGTRKDIPRLVEELRIEEIFITIPSASGETIREILSFCEDTKAKVKILPGIFRTMAGEVGLASVREISMEDLLGREPVRTDLSSISSYIENRVVLVTGAGGSVGSELSRQLCSLRPRVLLLLDKDESGLFDLEEELSALDLPRVYRSLVADVRDEARVEALFKRYRPQVVFHSAAMKHVPLMEFHPSEAVKNNVLGTRVLADACLRHGTERFILISTDKAVQAVNVMGATKQVAEMLVKHYGKRDSTLFTAVRFGNVLGSRGSVIPVFKRQIERGGPVTITHPDMTRYFMTVHEAVQLVIQAGAFTRGGDIFILDMGKPVRIMDLAREMIRLSGKEGQVRIIVTGLRPGEKLHEELTAPHEEMVITEHPMIYRLSHDMEPEGDFVERVDELIAAAVRDDEKEVRRLLSSLVPTYPGVAPSAQPGESIEVEGPARPAKGGFTVIDGSL